MSIVYVKTLARITNFVQLSVVVIIILFVDYHTNYVPFFYLSW